MRTTTLLAALMCASAAAQAQITPKVQPEVPVSGKSYVLVNKAQTASQYMSRTSWDGALYFLGETDSNYANHALTAIDNGDGTWSFTLPGTREVETGEYDENENPITKTEDAPYYMLLPGGTANVNVNSQDVKAKWILEAKEGGFYNLILGEGHNGAALSMAPLTPTGDLRMHLNAGGQYFVVTYFQGPWYPDCLGGIRETDDEATGNVYFAATDSTSFNWGFVSVENLPAYMADWKLVKLLNEYKAEYCILDGFEDGFQATLDAALALYGSEEYNEEDFDVINAMLQAKIALYKEIEAAILLNENEDPVLSAAIETAQDLFDKSTDATTVQTATTTLHQAEVNYSMGLGDVTSLGRNMSFEDLSAQGGQQSSGIAGAPFGWNVYVNGQQVSTAEEVRDAGIANWHGVNDDCSGEGVKDGNYGFGLWTPSVPTYEISQTIEGLENGTYIVTAGLMVGANGSGSRRTTQRIFGNLNATYFGSEEEYDLNKIDNSEVYAFAEQYEEVTDREMKPIEVRALVYDGTLTFGLRTDGNIAAARRSTPNSSSGDGWFKTDNFRIQKVGYVPEDAIAAFDHYADILAQYYSDNAFMAAAVSQQLAQKVEMAGSMTTETPLAEIAAAILEARDLLGTVDASVKDYLRLAEAIELHYDYLGQYDQKQGAAEYGDIIYQAEEALNAGTAPDAAAIDSIIAGLDAALQACIQSDEITEGMDLTEYIQNASFEDLSTQGGSSTGGIADAPKGWNLYLNGSKATTAAEISKAGIENWCGINGGDNISVELEDGTTAFNQYTDGEHLWGIWTSIIPEVELSQTIKGLPAGTYTLTCDVLVQYNWAGYCITTQRIFANDYVAMYSYEGNYQNNLPEDAQVAAAIDLLADNPELPHLTYAGHECEAPRSDYSHRVSLTFGLAQAGDVKIGFRTNNIDRDGVAQNQGKGWFKLDNWTLTYDSEEVPDGAEIDGLATDIKTVSTPSASAPAAFYTLSGTRLNAPQKGINIVRTQDGSVRKVLVK